MFYHLCYEGSVDLDKVKDLTARHALEVQISEFGQIPKQIFDKPHVSKTIPIPRITQNTFEKGGGLLSVSNSLHGGNVYNMYYMSNFTNNIMNNLQRETMFLKI